MQARKFLTTEAQRRSAAAYYEANRLRVLERYKALPEDIKKRRRASTRAWRALNKAKKAEYDRKWRIEHPEEWRALNRAQKNKPEARMLTNLRKRLREFIRQKGGRSSLLFGCSPSELRSHIESKFSANMAWTNYGTWHIDHIRPCCSFDLTVKEDRCACFHWTNLRPLWAAENIAKGRRWENHPNTDSRTQDQVL